MSHSVQFECSVKYPCQSFYPATMAAIEAELAAIHLALEGIVSSKLPRNMKYIHIVFSLSKMLEWNLTPRKNPEINPLGKSMASRYNNIDFI